MIGKKPGILATTFVLIAALAFLAGCGGSTDSNDVDANSSGESSQTTSPESASGQEGLPASFTAYGNNYSISNYSIESNEEGNTLVKCEGSGFSKLPMRNNAFQMPLSCVLVVDGKEVSWISGTAGGEGIEFEYEGQHEPSALIFMASDDETQRVEVSVK